MNITLGTEDAQKYVFVTGSGNQCQASTVNKYISKSWEESGAKEHTGKKFTATTNRKEHTTLGRRYEPGLADDIAEQLGHRRDTADRYYATDIKRRQSPCTVNRLRVILEGPDDDIDSQTSDSTSAPENVSPVCMKPSNHMASVDEVMVDAASTDCRNDSIDSKVEEQDHFNRRHLLSTPINRRFSEDLSADIASVYCDEIQEFLSSGKKPAMATIKRKRMLLNPCLGIVSNQQIRDKVVTLGKQQLKVTS